MHIQNEFSQSQIAKIPTKNNGFTLPNSCFSQSADLQNMPIWLRALIEVVSPAPHSFHNVTGHVYSGCAFSISNSQV